jgi:ADP-heptose:LPS heptosyltransferase
LVNAPFAQVKSLLSGAQLFVGNDSGPAHIAAAFGVPVVVLFGSSDPVTWAPWRTESQVLTAAGGIGGISVSNVIAAAEALKVKA